MPSIIDHSSSLRPYNSFFWHRYYTPYHTPMLFLLVLVMLGTQIREQYYHYVFKREVTQAQSWPTTLAQIGEITALPETVRDGKYSHHTEYHVKVDYKYIVDGQTHYSSQESFLNYPARLSNNSFLNLFSPGYLTYKQEAKNSLTDEFPHKSKHVVRYDPMHLDSAYIDTAVNEDTAEDKLTQNFLFGGLAIAALAIGLVSTGITKMR